MLYMLLSALSHYFMCKIISKKQDTCIKNGPKLNVLFYQY